MKKQFLKFSAVALTAAVMALYVSCDKTEDPTLNVSPNADVVFEANGTSNIGSPNYTFVVETNQGEFEVTKSHEWVKVNKTTTGFNLTADPISTLAGPPAAKVTVSAGSATPVEIGVTQKGAGSFLTVGPAHRTIIFTPNGEVCTIGTSDGEVFDPVEFTVGTNDGETWDAQKSAGVNWLTLTKSATGFSLEAEGHISLDGRETSVTVSTSGAAADVVITVRQAPMPAFLSVNGSEDDEVDVVFENTVGTKTFDVLTNFAGGWTIDELTPVSWLTLNKTANSFTLTVTENIYADVAEAVTVTVRAGEATSIKLLVTQKGNLAGSTRWAATQEIWVVNSIDGQIKQVWSDYIEYDGKGKVAAGTIDNFVDSKTGNAGFPNSGEGDYVRHVVTNRVPNTSGFDAKFKGYFYNYFYITENKDKLCPSPWRVPHEEDFIQLDLAFEGTGGNQGNGNSGTVDTNDAAWREAQVRKYMAWGLQFGGMRNNTGANTWDYVQGIGYLAGQDVAPEPHFDWFSTMKIGYAAGDVGAATVDGVTVWVDSWWIYTKHYGSNITSRGRERGWPVRCVRDVE